MIVWTTFHRASLSEIWMVSKVIERGVSISLFWRDVVRNIDCSDVFFFFKKKNLDHSSVQLLCPGWLA